MIQHNDDPEPMPEEFASSHRRAERYVRSPGKLRRLLEHGARKAAANQGRLGEAWEELMTFIRLLRAWASRDYRDVSLKAITLVAGALLYFVNPFDLIPDFLGVFGLVDDITVLTMVVSSVRGELRRFRQWEEGTLR